jgi:sulfide:quinone oxidoreductase
MSTAPFRVVVAGGGIAGMEALLTLHALAADRLDLTLVDPRPDFVYRPLTIAEPFGGPHARRYPLAALARDVGARLLTDAVVAVDDDEGVATTEAGERLAFDAVLLAGGARSEPAFAHALNWDEESGTERLAGLLRDVGAGSVRRLAFVVPPGPGWPLPAYELALMTAQRAASARRKPQITVVTPEPAPLAVFGPQATAAVSADLEEAGIGFHGAAYVDVEPGQPPTVVLHPGARHIEVDRVVALPRLVGRAPGGVPAGPDGFVAVDPHGRVRGLRRTWAAGDGIEFPVKFGGLAAEQADAAAEAIAAEAGAGVTPEPFRPVLRGRLLTGRGSRFLHHVAGGGGGDGTAADQPLWWPPGKVAGRRLSPYLAARDQTARGGPAPAPAGVAVQVDLTSRMQAGRAR